MVDIARRVSSIGAVERPPGIQSKQVFRSELVSFFRGDPLAPILDDELPLSDCSQGKEPEPGSRPCYTKQVRAGALRRHRLRECPTSRLAACASTGWSPRKCSIGFS